MSADKIIPLRINPELHDQLRTVSFYTKIPMAELMRQGIQLKINKYKKLLTNIKVNV